MGIIQTLILIFVSIIVRVTNKGLWRKDFLFIICIIIIYWLQPLNPIHYLDFWLPTTTLIIITLSWIAITPTESRKSNENTRSIILLICIVIGISLTRYLSINGLITASRPPQIWQIMIVIIITTIVIMLYQRYFYKYSLTWPIFGVILCLFFIQKFIPLTSITSEFLRNITNQSSEIKVTNIQWLGFSYLAFRIIHTLRDTQTGKLVAVSLNEYLIYIIFFPAVIAGPIDRLPRFIDDLRKTCILSSEEITDAGKRIIVGLFKKFVIADTLSIVALNPVNATQVNDSFWMWVLVYAFSLQIYFDFSGYTDLAIGLGGLLGIKLPENFNRPYLRSNLTLFWNEWHITLTQWFRAYIFNPLTRSLKRSKFKFPAWSIILITQITTMVLIGLWHGINSNFILWGLWHGLGLFFQNRWTNWIKLYAFRINNYPWIKNVSLFLGIFLTFHYVSLGWVLFILPNLDLSWRVFCILSGVNCLK